MTYYLREEYQLDLSEAQGVPEPDRGAHPDVPWVLVKTEFVDCAWRAHHTEVTCYWQRTVADGST